MATRWASAQACGGLGRPAQGAEEVAEMAGEAVAIWARGRQKVQIGPKEVVGPVGGQPNLSDHNPSPQHDPLHGQLGFEPAILWVEI